MDKGCDQIREALSARLDGEEVGDEAGFAPGAIEEHLAGCAECGLWLAKAEEVTRAVRVQLVDVPDLTAPILAAVRADAAAQRAGARAELDKRRRLMRLALALTAALQLALAIPMLLGLGDIAHDTREAASFDIALAVGFALAAWRPDRARAFVPVAFVLAACLTLTSAFDIIEGAALFAHEIGHVAALAQAALLWGLSRGTTRALPRPREAATS
ncbi:MAG TPA: hypothetical protein VF062_02570 [Candidatus Limnocylindrales bacterium]